MEISTIVDVEMRCFSIAGGFRVLKLATAFSGTRPPGTLPVISKPRYRQLGLPRRTGYCSIGKDSSEFYFNFMASYLVAGLKSVSK